MRILHIYKDYYPVMGGIENIVKLVAEAQVAAGHDVTVLVASLDRKTRIKQMNGVVVHKVARWGTFASTPLTPGLPLALSRYQTDIAHIHSPYPPGELVNSLLGKSTFSVITYHSDIVRQKMLLKFYKPFLELALKKVDLIMPTSANYVETSPFLRAHKHKCRIVPLGIDVSRFDLPTLPLARELKRCFGPSILLFVGRLRYYKGLNTLIDAMPHITTGNLIIVGNGPLRSDLEAKVQALQLEQRVHFAGEVSNEDLPAYFQSADCFVLPSNSRAEAFGLVLLEAMAAGLPLISTELGTGTSFVNLHNRTGYVVSPAAPLPLAKAINTLMSDEPLRRQFARTGLARVKAEFSKEVMVGRIMQAYEEL